MVGKPPKELQNHWYQKLKENGFNDIEDTSSPREMLKSWHSTLFIHRYEKERFTARQQYFEIVTQFLHSHEFESELEREIWFLHSEGKSLREIATITGEVSKDGALKIIRKLLRSMKDGTTSGH